MSKILNITRDGNHFTMTVQHEDNEKERLYYERVVTSTGVSFIQTGKEHQ